MLSILEQDLQGRKVFSSKSIFSIIATYNHQYIKQRVTAPMYNLNNQKVLNYINWGKTRAEIVEYWLGVSNCTDGQC